MFICQNQTMSLRIGLLASCIGLMAQTPVAPAASPLTTTQIQTLKAAFHRLCQERRVVGASVMVLEGDRELLLETHGFQDEAAKVLVNRTSAFHWASITKTFTSVAVLQARDRGLLSLDDPITKYLPELRRVHNPFGSMDAITIRHLLTHSAGFRSSTWPWKKGKDWEPFEPTEWSQLVAMLPYTEIEFAPGTRSDYSNPGYIFLGRVIEEVTGDPFVSYVEKNILRPLGMQESYFNRAPHHLISRRSHSYTWLTEKDIRVEDPFDFHTGITTANGGLNAPLPDMAKYIRFLTGKMHRDQEHTLGLSILSQNTIVELMAPVQKSPSFGDGVWRTLGFFRAPYNGTDWINHTGGQNGFRSIIEFEPLTGRAVILVFNTDDDWDGEKKMPDGFLPTPPMGKVVRAYLDMVSPPKAPQKP